MTAKKLSELEIAARIVPTVLRWPPPDVAKTIAWDRLREGVTALRGLVETVDAHCVATEQDHDLSPDGVARRRTELGRRALAELEEFKTFQLAEKEVAQNLEYLENKMVDLPKPPSSVAEVALAQEIRQHICNSKPTIDGVLKSISDPRVLGAILNAPPFLSGLSDVEFNLVRQRARAILHPEQTEMQEHLKKALADLRGGVSAARRAVMERCEVRDDGARPISGDKPRWRAQDRALTNLQKAM